jgi:hypothetical protein
MKTLRLLAQWQRDPNGQESSAFAAEKDLANA